MPWLYKLHVIMNTLPCDRLIMARKILGPIESPLYSNIMSLVNICPLIKPLFFFHGEVRQAAAGPSQICGELR